MYIHLEKHHASVAELSRLCARTFAVFLFLTWLGLVILEAAQWGPYANFEIVYQAGTLAIVFVGYAVGWRHELVGGMLVVFGTVAFFAANWFTSGWFPTFESAWFALPGVLFLLAWLSDHRHRVA